MKDGPLPGIRHHRERQVETDVVCSNCTLHYSVFGLFAYCPDCGNHNSLQVLERNIALVEKQVGLALSLEHADLKRHLIEDALENCVSAFDGFAREVCRVRAEKSADATRASNLSFQNLANADAAIRNPSRSIMLQVLMRQLGDWLSADSSSVILSLTALA